MTPRDPSVRDLASCGCCEGIGASTPGAVFNRPGLSAIAYRSGRWHDFKASLLAALSGSAHPELAELATRAATTGWCVTALAQSCGVSVPTFERFFHETKQQCPREWINAERMRRACELLERRERIKDIAEGLCYGHSQNFCTAFTKHFGYSPREHLRRMSRDEGRESRASEGRARHSVRAAPDAPSPPRTARRHPRPIGLGEGLGVRVFKGQGEVLSISPTPQAAKSEIGNHSSWSQIRL